MKKFLIIVLIVISCKNVNNDTVKTSFEIVKSNGYELHKPTKNIKAILILFGGYPEKTADIKREFPILKRAKKKNIAVLYLNYNQKLWLEKSEKKKLVTQLQNIFKNNVLPTDNIYIGGFSSGGNVSLLISDFIAETKINIVPKGVFIIDSPIDLIALYKSAEKNINRNFSKIAVQESNWILKTLGKKLGNPNKDISNYEKYAVYTSKTNNIDNLKNLKNIKIRFYTEPETIWWRKERMADYKQTNAYYIKSLSKTLIKSKFKNVEYIPTINKGYRANGEKHPHSWSIVNKENLIEWMLN